MGIKQNLKIQKFSEEKFILAFTKVTKYACRTAIPYAILVMGLINENEKYLDSMIQILNQLLGKKDKSAPLLFALAYSQVKRKLDRIWSGTLSVSTEKEFYFSLGWSCHGTKEIITLLQEARRLDTNNPHSDGYLAVCHAIVSDFVNANISLDRMKRNRHNAKGLTNNLDFLEKVTKLVIQLQRILIILSGIDEYDHDEFIKEIEEAGKSTDIKNYLFYYIFQYEAHIKIKDYDHAISYLHKAESLFTDNVLIYDMIARYSLWDGDYSQALKYFEKALKIYVGGNGRYRIVDCMIFREVSSAMLKWPRLNLLNYEENKREVYIHLNNCMKLIKENEMTNRNHFLTLPLLLDIDERISGLQSSHNLFDLEARIANIYSNLTSIYEHSDLSSIEIDKKSLVDMATHVNSIYQVKVFYMMFLWGIMKQKGYNNSTDISGTTDVEAERFAEKMLENVFSFLTKMEYEKEIAAFNDLETFAEKIGGRSIDEIPEDEQSRLLRALFEGFETMNGSFSGRSVRKILISQHDILSKVKEVKDEQKLVMTEVKGKTEVIEASVLKLTNLIEKETKRSAKKDRMPVLDKEKIKILTNVKIDNKGKLTKELSNKISYYEILEKELLKQDKERYLIWLNYQTGECFLFGEPFIRGVKIREKYRRLITYFLINPRCCRFNEIYEVYNGKKYHYAKTRFCKKSTRKIVQVLNGYTDKELKNYSLDCGELNFGIDAKIHPWCILNYESPINAVSSQYQFP